MTDNYSKADFQDEVRDLEHGIQKERESLDYFRETLDQMTGSSVQALYQWFVDYGQVHVSELEAIHAEVTKEQVWSSGLEERINATDSSVGESPALEEQPRVKLDRSDLMSLRQAILHEKQTASVYFTAVRRARNDHARALWRYLARNTESHKNVLENTFDRLLKLALQK
ncbi:MAG: hypothetical protein MUO58_00075 [Anaerolineales bacterium]|nr:hypothetical protein [Anaerolineales bacterium]